MKRGVDYTGVTVVYACHDGAGEYLFGKRTRNCRDEHGRWDIGGGAVEFGDTAEQTLRKEIAEEYLTDVVSYEFLGFRDVFREHESASTHWIALDFKVRVDRAKIGIGEPHKIEALAWHTLNALPEPVHSQFPVFFSKYRDRLFSDLDVRTPAL